MLLRPLPSLCNNLNCYQDSRVSVSKVQILNCVGGVQMQICLRSTHNTEYQAILDTSKRISLYHLEKLLSGSGSVGVGGIK